MKQRLSFLIFSIIFTMILSGCYKISDLELQNPGAMTPDNFYADSTNALQAVMGMYSSLHQQSMWGQHEVVTENQADDVVCGDGNAESIALDRFSNVASSAFTTGWWRSLYVGIGRIHNAIEGIAKVPSGKITDVDRKKMIAEGKFLRGLYYLNLVSRYGDVPLITKTVDQNNIAEFMPSRSAQSKVFAQIIKDFKDAKADLPAKWESKYVGRATKGAASAYLGKAYLYYACHLKNFGSDAAGAATNYGLAAIELKSIIDNKATYGYDLDPSYSHNFTYGGENNIESIFEIQFSDKVNRGTWGENGQGETRQWMTEPNWVGGWQNSKPNYYAYKKLMNIDSTDHVRIVGDIWGAPGSMYNDQPLYKHLGYTVDKIPQSQWGYGKYVFAPKPGEDFFGDWSGLGFNFKLMRYADVLLMYAEAQNEATGPDQSAYDAVNAVRTRVGLGGLPAGLSKAGFLTRIQNERYVEFMCEDLRWFDIKRWKIGTEVFAALNTFNNSDPNGDKTTANFNDNHYYWPIPQSEITMNSNLLPQNTGY